MNEQDQDILEFFKQQIEWYKEQDLILAKIEGKLNAMKALAEYRLERELSFGEVRSLNMQLQELKVEVLALEQQLYKGIVN